MNINIHVYDSGTDTTIAVRKPSKMPAFKSRANIGGELILFETFALCKSFTQLLT